jgi:cell division protein FtsN
MVQNELNNLNKPTNTTNKRIYRVQVGAYSNYNNAKTMQEKLKKLGIDSYIKEE